MTTSFFNIKLRAVFCEYCKYYKNTSEPGPKCEHCGSEMITVLVSNIDTSVKLNELGPASS